MDLKDSLTSTVELIFKSEQNL